MSQVRMINSFEGFKLKQDQVDKWKAFTQFDPAKKQWRMRCKKLNMQKISQFLSCLEQAECQIVYGDLNHRKTIAMQLCQLNLFRLKVLDLGHNKIQSIQLLGFAVIPSLEKIWLNNNNIVSLRALERSYTPNLKVIWISDNFIKQVSLLADWKHLTQLYLQKNIINSFANLMKCNFQQLTWSAICANPGGEDESIVNSGVWESRLRWKFRKMQRVWMPLYFSNAQHQYNTLGN